MKRVLKILGYTLLGLGSVVLLVVTLALTAAGIVWLKPQWVLNNQNVARAANYLRPKGIALDLTASDLRVSSTGFAQKRLDWDFQKFCIKMSEGKTDVCVNDGRIRTSFIFNRFGMPRVRVEELVSGEARVAMDLRTPQPQAAPAKKDSGPFTLPEWIYKIEPGHVALGPVQLDLQMAARKIESNFSLRKESNDPWITLTLHKIEMGLENKVALSPSTVRLNLQRDQVQFEAKAGALVRKVGRVKVDVASAWRFPQGLQSAHFDLDFRDLKTATRANFRGTFANQRLDGHLRGRYYLAKTSMVERVDVESCALAGSLKDASLVCKPVLVINPARRQEWSKAWAKFQGPTRLPTEIRLGIKEEADGDYRAKLGLFSAARGATLYSFDFNTDLESSYKRFQELGYRAIQGKVSFALRVPQFRPVAELINGLGLALVPAPVNGLDGLIYVESKDIRIEDGLLTAPIQLGTKLSSRDQRLFTRGAVELRGELKKETAQLCLSSAVLDIQDAYLQMPRFEVIDPPRFIGDSRFDKPLTKLRALEKEAKVSSTDKAVAKAGSCPKPFIKVNTTKPIQVVTHQLPEPLPIGLSYVSGGKSRALKDEINIEVSNYTAELLRRQVRVEKMNISLGEMGTLVDGKFSMHFPQYEVALNIRGPSDKLTFNLQSDPPLPQMDIVSLILYGRPSSTLTQAEANSASRMQAAMADAALGLFSLYVFASTPIQSIGYDARTGVVAAVGLGGDFTLNVAGTTDQLNTVGISRDLGNNWRITTSVDEPTQQTNRLTALLQWAKFF